jgi:hypothetical protein
MQSRFAPFLLLAFLTGLSMAQSNPTRPTAACTAGPVSTIDDRDGVTIKTISLRGDFGRVDAHIFLPDTPDPVAGIAFSYSSIQYADSRTDLLPYARTLARAGAASIMIDGPIEWRTPNNDSKRPVSEMACAAEWLMANANLDFERLAVGGPIKRGSDPFCAVSDREPCGQAWFHLNFGWNGDIEAHFTDLMKTPKGQLWFTRLPEAFHLKEVKLAWLTEDALPKAMAQR